MNWYLFYQEKGGEDDWRMALAADRAKIVAERRPAFTTVLDLNLIPDDGDWSKTRYRGPFYADFDAGDDLELVCDQVKTFMGKLDAEIEFDLTQARFYASGSKGFHIEVPQESFIPKPSAQGYPWLPYVYREVAQSLMVDTLDLKVYTGKRGRMWRTPNVQRDNGCFKVPLTLSDMLDITPDLYRELIKAPRTVPEPTPASCNTHFAMLFERSREKVTAMMRGKKKRVDQANALLEPWKRAKKHPPTIEMIMRGENVADGVGFQQLAMQLSIYATSVGMSLDEFLSRCDGLIENHVSDSRRYNSRPKRREELARMWRYMDENSLYEFDVGPVARLVKPGTSITDLGVVDREDHEDRPAAEEGSEESPVEDLHRGVRKGFFMNGDGMFRQNGDKLDPVCRGTLRNVEAFYDLERAEFKGYEFDICVKGRKTKRVLLGAEAFTSSTALRKFFVSQQLSFQGAEAETAALLDIIAEKAMKNGHVQVFPREGFFIIDHPDSSVRDPVKVYLTKSVYLSSIPEGDPNYFRLRYHPTQANSAFDIDVHRAPALGDEHRGALHDLFSFSRPETLADLIGWFVACHYRSVYLYLFDQFPLLQLYGEAGSGKTQTIMLLARLHWYLNPVSIKSASGFTNYALDSHVSSSTSAPLILDEYKPREMRARGRGMYEKIKDALKASYVAGDIGERGTINKLHDHASLIRSKVTAPIVFMGESIEMETAIIERCVTVAFSKSYQTREREAAFERLKADPSALSALGRAVVEMGFALDIEKMRDEVAEIRDKIRDSLPDFNDETKRRMAPRLIYNRAVVIHGLRILQAVLQRQYGNEFDGEIEQLLGARTQIAATESALVEAHAASEISKVLSRIALLSRDRDMPWEMKAGADYLVGDGWVEIKVERSYDCYRRYCASVHDQPLFDNLDAFTHALNSFSPVIDRVCASSDLRADDSTERVVRFDLQKLNREGVQSFKT